MQKSVIEQIKANTFEIDDLKQSLMPQMIENSTIQLQKTQISQLQIELLQQQNLISKLSEQLRKERNNIVVLQTPNPTISYQDNQTQTTEHEQYSLSQNTNNLTEIMTLAKLCQINIPALLDPKICETIVKKLKNLELITKMLEDLEIPKSNFLQCMSTYDEKLKQVSQKLNKLTSKVTKINQIRVAQNLNFLQNLQEQEVEKEIFQKIIQRGNIDRQKLDHKVELLTALVRKLEAEHRMAQVSVGEKLFDKEKDELIFRVLGQVQGGNNVLGTHGCQ
ncbi:hypothetical protein SS50377_20785 [Spironucleus salmonicida]|uniref:Uncharacterized protein n=1 Tax=Spironucleus salmonicida TaxID=348837 RepID=V6LQZ9_9EUKA|nr:hypothetical protein SS50377_20785 [Spironucleus salmonicida]|eukprot:EST47107.1 Hypothetical protein SS50377_12813 [Spironucleus salmonicida]